MSSYYILFLIVLVGAWVEGNFMWSRSVLSKNKNILFWNNLLIVIEIGLIIFIFWKYSWKGGLAALVAGLIIGIISARRAIKKFAGSVNSKLKKIV